MLIHGEAAALMAANAARGYAQGIIVPIEVLAQPPTG
jgi:hypothetical protein